MTTTYRYLIAGNVPIEEIEATLVLSLFATEALCGEAQTRLDAAHSLDAESRAVTIDASTEVGRALNRVFTGLVSREFGAGSFTVERVEGAPRPQEKPEARPEPVTA